MYIYICIYNYIYIIWIYTCVCGCFICPFLIKSYCTWEIMKIVSTTWEILALKLWILASKTAYGSVDTLGQGHDDSKNRWLQCQK